MCVPAKAGDGREWRLRHGWWLAGKEVLLWQPSSVGMLLWLAHHVLLSDVRMELPWIALDATGVKMMPLIMARFRDFPVGWHDGRRATITRVVDGPVVVCSCY
ncbi:hypothetical protein ACLOJK_018591 [Asimina triloba]